MGKAEPGSAKAIGNRIKAAGLQKLKFYCQMCQKQCRDANGFKCHLTSDSHRRQMEIFSQNSSKFMDSFSSDFLAGFMDILKRRYQTKRVLANRVYNEYIQDRHHIHMNSTRWTTLTAFVQHLGKEGLVRVDQTEEGWWVAYINRDMEALKRQEALRRKEKMDLTDDERMQRFLRAQMKNARKQEGSAGAGASAESHAPEELRRDADAAPIKLSLGSKLKARKTDSSGDKPTREHDRERERDRDRHRDRDRRRDREGSGDSDGGQSKRRGGGKRKRSALDDLMEEDRRRKERAAHRSAPPPPSPAPRALAAAPRMDAVKKYWLREGIVVKVVAKKPAAYYKCKGTVIRVEDRYTGVVRVNEPRATLRLDQDAVETVIPKPGGRVMVVNGTARGECGTVRELLTDRFQVRVRLDSGETLNKDYEHVSKVARE